MQLNSLWKYVYCKLLSTSKTCQKGIKYQSGTEDDRSCLCNSFVFWGKMDLRSGVCRWSQFQNVCVCVCVALPHVLRSKVHLLKLDILLCHFKLNTLVFLYLYSTLQRIRPFHISGTVHIRQCSYIGTQDTGLGKQMALIFCKI